MKRADSTLIQMGSTEEKCCHRQLITCHPQRHRKGDDVSYVSSSIDVN